MGSPLVSPGWKQKKKPLKDPRGVYFPRFLGVDHFKVIFEFITVLLLFYVLVFWPRSICDVNLPTRNQTCTSPPLEGKLLTSGP